MKLNEEKKPQMLAGFWIRVLSDGIDAAVLWAVGFGLGSLFESTFSNWGEKGILLGFVLSIFYFVPAQSFLGKGQSLGKKITRIEVLALDGRHLSFGKSFLRFLIVSLVSYTSVYSGMAGLFLGQTLQLSQFFLFLAILTFFGCYLIVPFQPLKRGLHDFAVGSIVVLK
jgi:uncharacterized RDD family membrane protein YckC